MPDKKEIHLRTVVGGIDVKTGSMANSPEYGIMQMAGAQMARFYNLLSLVCGGCSDSKLPDVQAGFERATAKLGIHRYFSSVKTPKDNLDIERFNETLEYEWLYNLNLSLDPEELNPRLTEWLIEYNFNRPHQALAYLTPVEYIEKELAKIRSPVLPMWSASTIVFQLA